MTDFKFASRMEGMTGNVIREILKLTQEPDIISFAGGLPSPESFPAEELSALAQEVLLSDGPMTLQYGTTEGYMPLREHIAEWVSERGIGATVGNVLILSGSQQGIDLAARAFIDPGDVVLVESPTYLAALHIFRSYEARFQMVPSDDMGMQVDALEEIIQRAHPKLIYVVPTFQNPTGVTMVLERRKKLAEIAARYDIVVIEDDPYSDLRYSGERIPPLKSFDQAGNIIYLGSYSKIISPGLRCGFAVAHPTVLRKMVIGKQANDVHTSNLSMRLVYEYSVRGLLKPHIEKICAQYKVKRDRMLAAIEANFPAGTEWTRPDGGLFIWVRVPEGIDAVKVLEEAIKDKVAFIPGSPFFADGSGQNTMRLNFSNASLSAIDEGMERLGRTLRRAYGDTQGR